MVKNPNFQYPEAVVKFFYRNRGYSQLPDDEKYRLQQILLFWTMKDRAAWNNFLAGLIKQRICVKYLNDQALLGVISAARQSLAHKFGKQEVPFDPDVPACYYWTEHQCAQWIVEEGFPEMKEAFLVNHITGRKLVTVDASALSKMGVRYFDKIKAITAKIRELLQIPRPNAMRAIMRMVPMEKFLRKKVYCGRNYDVLTFKKFCENEGFPYSLLLKTSKTAELAMTCKTKFYLDPGTMTPTGSDEGSETVSLLDAPSVEFIARTTLVRNRVVQNIIDEMLENVMLPPHLRKYGAVIYRTITEIIELALADLGLESESKERVEFLEDISKNLLEEMVKTHEVLKDIQVTRKFIKKGLSEEDYEDMKAVAEVFNEEVFPIAAMLSVGELDLEAMFKSEPFYQEFVTEIANEAEHMTNALAPDAAKLVDQVILESKLRLLLMMFPEMTLEDVKQADGDELDEERIEIFLKEGLEELDKEKQLMESFAGIVIDEEEEEENFSEDLHLGPYRILAARRGSDLTWAEKLDPATGNPDVSLLTESELDALMEGTEFPTFEGTREIDTELRGLIQEEKNNRQVRRRMAAQEIQKQNLRRNVPGKRNEYGAYEEFTLAEKFYPDGAPILTHLTTEELEMIINQGVSISPDGGTVPVEENEEIRAGARREVAKRKTKEALSRLQLDNYKRKFPGYITPNGEFHEYTIAEKQDLEGTPIVNRLDYLELKKLASEAVFNGTSYKHIPGILDDAQYEMEKREQEEIQAKLQQQIFMRKFPGRLVLGEHEEYPPEEKFSPEGDPIVEKFSDTEIEGLLEFNRVRLPNGEVVPVSSQVIREARQERAKRDKLTYRARFQLQNFRQKYPRRSFAVLESRSKVFNIHQRYDSSGKPIYERLSDTELEEILKQKEGEEEESEDILRARQEKQERENDAAIHKKKLSVTEISLTKLDTKKSEAPVAGYFAPTQPRRSRIMSAETARRQKVLNDIRDLVLAATKDKEPEPVDATLALFNGFIIDDVSNVIGTVRPTDGTIRENTGEIIGHIAHDGIVILEEGAVELGRVGADVEQIGVGKFRALPKLIRPIDPNATVEGVAAVLGSRLKYSKCQALPGWNKYAAEVKGGVLVKEGGTWVRKDSSERLTYNKQLARQILLAEDYNPEQVILVSDCQAVKEREEAKAKAREEAGGARDKKGAAKKKSVRVIPELRKSGGDELEQDQGMVKWKAMKPPPRRSGKRDSRKVQSEPTLDIPDDLTFKEARKSRKSTLGEDKAERDLAARRRKSLRRRYSEIPGEGGFGFEIPGETTTDEERLSRGSGSGSSLSSSEGSIIRLSDVKAVLSKKDLKGRKSQAEIAFTEARKSVTAISVPVPPVSGKWGKQEPPPEDEEDESMEHPFKPRSPPAQELRTGGSKESMQSAGTVDAAEMMAKIASGEARKLVDDDGKVIGEFTKDGNILGPYGGVIGFVQPNGAVFRSDKSPWKGGSVRIIRQNGIVIGRVNSRGRLQVDRDTHRSHIGNVWADGRIVTLQNTLVGIITKDGRIIGETGDAIALFTPTFEILGSNGLPFAYVSSEGKVYRYDMVPQLRYNPKSKTQEEGFRKTSIDTAFDKAMKFREEDKDKGGLKKKRSTLSARKSVKLKVLDEETGEQKKSVTLIRPELSEEDLERKQREKEKRKTLEQEALMRQYNQDAAKRAGQSKVEVKEGETTSAQNLGAGVYSKEDLKAFASELKVDSTTDHRELMAQELLLKEKQLHRRQMVERWAQERGADDLPDKEEYWAPDPDLGREEQLRACRMAADSILDDIFRIALTHLLLQAEAGVDTERIIECLAKIETTGNEEGLTLWQVHLEQLGQYGENLMKKMSHMLPEPGDNEVWRIVAEKAKQAKEKDQQSSEGTGSSKTGDDHHHHHHHHKHHHHEHRHTIHGDDHEHHHEHRRTIHGEEHHHEHRRTIHGEHRHTIHGDEHHHHHHHHGRHSHRPDVDELETDEKFHDPDYDERHHHHHRHSHKHSGSEHKPYKPPAGPLGRVLETDEIEQIHAKREHKLSNKLPEMPVEFLYGKEAQKKSEMMKKREQLQQQKAQQPEKLPHIPHPGVVARGGLLQEIEREDVAEQIHHGKEKLARFETKILPQNMPLPKRR